MPTQVNGLPAHVLLIHAILALVPLAALLLVATAVWPAARARLGVVTPLVALLALVFVPVTTNAGEWLQEHLPNDAGHTNPLIRRHAELGHQLLPWVAGIFLLAAVGWWLGRRYDLDLRSARGGRGARADVPDEDPHAPGTGDGAGRGATATVTRTARPVPAPRSPLPAWVAPALAVVSVAVAVVTMIQLYRIGDSGAQAVWHGATSGG